MNTSLRKYKVANDKTYKKLEFVPRPQSDLRYCQIIVESLSKTGQYRIWIIQQMFRRQQWLDIKIWSIFIIFCF